MIIGILGILKAGAAYVPFDSADPEERLRFKINDCACKMVLTSSSYSENLVFLTETDTIPLAIDSYWDEISRESKLNPKHINKSTDLAYVIYTSGSTGNPKGVMIEHKSVVNSTLSRYYFYKSYPESFLLISPFTFDSSVAGIFWTILGGKKLNIISQNLLTDYEKVISLIYRNNITEILCVPSYYSALLDTMEDKKESALKRIIIAGEKCSSSTLFKHYNKLSVQLFNEYCDLSH